MPQTLEQIKSEAGNLTPEERAELAQYLLSTLDEESEADVTAAWNAELARRAEKIKSGKAVGIPAEQVFADLRAKYS